MLLAQLLPHPLSLVSLGASLCSELSGSGKPNHSIAVPDTVHVGATVPCFFPAAGCTAVWVGIPGLPACKLNGAPGSMAVTCEGFRSWQAASPLAPSKVAQEKETATCSGFSWP